MIEVAVVVVIVGILAVLAVVAYRRRIAAARMTEATDMMTGIRKGQEAHKTETGLYADVSGSLSSFYPNPTPGPMVTAWGGPCSNCANGDVNAWDKLGVHASAPVIFGYATTAGVGGSRLMRMSRPSNSTPENEIDTAMSSQEAVIQPGEPSFVALAESDVNGDGVKCHVLALSHSNQIVVTNEGE